MTSSSCTFIYDGCSGYWIGYYIDAKTILLCCFDSRQCQLTISCLRPVYNSVNIISRRASVIAGRANIVSRRAALSARRGALVTRAVLLLQTMLAAAAAEPTDAVYERLTGRPSVQENTAASSSLLCGPRHELSRPVRAALCVFMRVCACARVYIRT